MKKASAAVLCLLLLLGACRAEKEDGFSGQEDGAAALTAPLSPAEAAALKRGEEKEQAEYEADFLRIMEELAAVQPESAGSSLRAYSAACAVLDFAERHGEGGEEWLKNRLTQHLADEQASGSEILREGWQAAAGAAQEILEKGTKELKDLLFDAGSPNRYEVYHRESYDPVAAILEEQLGGSKK